MKKIFTFFDDISIKIKVWSIAIVPLTAFLIVCLFMLFEDFNSFKDARNADDRLKLMLTLHEVVDELQQERGMSVGFISGADVKDKLKKKRDVSDQKINNFLKELEKVELVDDPVFSGVKKDLLNVADFRVQVDNKITLTTHLKNYTGLIVRTLKKYMELEKFAGRFGVSKLLLTVSNLEDAKENEGKLRANMTSMLAKGMPVDLDQQDLIIGLKNGVDAYLKSNFMDLSGKKGQVLVNRMELDHWGSADFTYVTLLNASTEEKGSFDEDHIEFFNIISKCVADIKAAVLENLSRVEIGLHSAREDALRSFIRLAIITAVLLLVLIMVIVLTTTSISAGVSKILEFVTQIGQGDLEAKLDMNSKNELGMIGTQLKFTAAGLKETRKSNEKIVRNLRSLSAPVYEIDSDFNINFINKQAAELAGLSTLECINKKCYDIFKFDICQTEDCTCDKTMQTNGVVESYSIMTLPDGSKKPMHYFANEVKDDDGNVSGALGFLIDMTDIYEVAKQLRSAAISMGKIATNTEATTKSLDMSSKDLNQQSSSTSMAVNNITVNMANVSEKSARSNSEVATIATGAEEMKVSMDSVSASIKMLSDSFGEIVEASQGATDVADQASKESDSVSKTMSELIKVTESIGNFVEVITGIASQTNLLALNATIEAARAGDAGKGFAVVANEVKELSKQTTGSADDISVKIDDIQNVSTESSEKIETVIDTLKEIQEKNRKVAKTVEVQSGVTTEIATSVTDAADAVTEVARSIDSVRQGVEEISNSVNEVSAEMQEISKSTSGVSSASASVAKDTQELKEIAVEVTNLKAEFENVIKQFELLDRL